MADTMTKSTFLLLLLVSVVSGGVLFFRSFSAPSNTPVATQEAADISVRGVNLSQGRDGKKIWTLKARQADYSQDSEHIRLQAPHIIYMRADATEPVRARAPRGEVNQRKKTMRLTEGVSIHSDSLQITADELLYSEQTHTLLFKKAVTIQNPALQLKSPEATLDIQTNSIVASGGVVCVIAND